MKLWRLGNRDGWDREREVKGDAPERGEGGSSYIACSRIKGFIPSGAGITQGGLHSLGSNSTELYNLRVKKFPATRGRTEYVTKRYLVRSTE